MANRSGGPSGILVEGRPGVGVPPDGPRRVSEALCALEADPELRLRMGRRGRDHVLAHFSAEAYAQRLTEALLEALSDPSRGWGEGRARGVSAEGAQ